MSVYICIEIVRLQVIGSLGFRAKIASLFSDAFRVQYLLSSAAFEIDCRKQKSLDDIVPSDKMQLLINIRRDNRVYVQHFYFTFACIYDH